MQYYTFAWDIHDYPYFMTHSQVLSNFANRQHNKGAMSMSLPFKFYPFLNLCRVPILALYNPNSENWLQKICLKGSL